MANSPAPRRFRVAGSKYTAFFWQGTLIALAEQVSHTSPPPVAQPVAIQPLDAAHPLEIITPAATGMGTFVLQLTETYGQKVWDQLAVLAGANDLADVFNRIAAWKDPITITKHIFPPAGSGVQAYFETYHNCVVSNIEDGEVITVGTMQVYKNLTVNYTYSTRGGGGTI